MTNYSLNNLEKERKVGWGKNPTLKFQHERRMIVTRCNKRRNGYNTTLMNQKLHRSMQRKALLHQKYHRVRSIRKDILGLVFSSRIKPLGSRHTTASGNAGRGRFRGFFKHFDEKSENTRVPLGLAPPKSGLTRFLPKTFKFNCRKETTNV